LLIEKLFSLWPKEISVRISNNTNEAITLKNVSRPLERTKIIILKNIISIETQWDSLFIFSLIILEIVKSPTMIKTAYNGNTIPGILSKKK